MALESRVKDGSLLMVVPPALFSTTSDVLKIVRVALKRGRVAVDSGTNGVLEKPFRRSAMYVSCVVEGLGGGDCSGDSQTASASNKCGAFAAPMS